MNFFKIIYRTGAEDWETGELIVNENQHKIIQEALMGGDDYIMIKDKITLKRSSIISISFANDIVGDYQKIGVRVDGLLEPVKIASITGTIKSTKEVFREKLADMRAELEKREWWKKSKI